MSPRAFFISPTISWLLTAIIFILVMSTSGCRSLGITTEKECLVRAKNAELRGEDAARDMALIDHAQLNDAWLERYCNMAISEEIRYAYATNKHELKVPKICEKFMVKGWHKK